VYCIANSPPVEQISFTNGTAQRMVTRKAYDSLNRLTNISSANSYLPSPISYAYPYNTANQRTGITNGDASFWAYGYDSLGQVTSGKKYWSDGTPVAGEQFEYTFDDIGNRKSTKAGGDGSGNNLRSANYSNNILNQITSREIPGYENVLGTANSNASVLIWSGTNSYSVAQRHGEYFRGELSANNSSSALWLGITNLAILRTPTNEILATNIGNVFIPKTAEVFGYDLDGNATNDGRWTYAWDAENRLIAMESLTNAPAGSKLRLEFAYDSQWRRIQKTVYTNNGSTYGALYTNRFSYDGWNLLAALSPLSSLLSSYTWGLDLSGSLQGAGGVGGLLFVGDFASAIGNCAVAHDGNGNVMALVNAATGVASALYEYGPFGEPLRATGPMATINPFLFSTKFYDRETGFEYYGYRYYNPSAGRWLSRDPIWDKKTTRGSRPPSRIQLLYPVCNNDCLSRLDYLGLYDSDGCFGSADDNVKCPLSSHGMCLHGFYADTLKGTIKCVYGGCPNTSFVDRSQVGKPTDRTVNWSWIGNTCFCFKTRDTVYQKTKVTMCCGRETDTYSLRQTPGGPVVGDLLDQDPTGPGVISESLGTETVTDAIEEEHPEMDKATCLSQPET
jgi:RHS repeat-associated protein